MKKLDIKSLRAAKFREICIYAYYFMECKEVAKCLMEEEEKYVIAGKTKVYNELLEIVILKMMNNFFGDIASPIRISCTRMKDSDKLALKLLYMLEDDQEWQSWFINEHKK